MKSNLIRGSFGAAKADWFLLLPLLGCLCASAAGQLVTVDGGRGLTGEPSGGVVGVNFGKWKMEGSLGVFNGSVVGGADVSVQLNRQWSVKAGDQIIDLDVPTDVYLKSSVMTRGASLEYSPSQATRIQVFGGMAGGGGIYTLTSLFTPEIPLGAISIDHYLGPKKRFLLFGRALFSNQQTILGGMLYQTKRLQTGFAVGTGSNQPYAEGLLNYKDTRWDIRERYLHSGSRFQLLTMPQFRLLPENGENVDVRWSPWKISSFSAGRHEYLDLTSAGTATNGTTDSAGGVISLHGVAVGANVFESRFKGTYTSASSFFASRRLTKAVNLSGNYNLPLHAANQAPMLSINVNESLSRRIRLSEYASHMNRRWTVNYGGGLHWDWFDVDLGYVTNFIPLAAAGGRFEQSMSVNGNVILGRWSIGVNSIVQPDGSVVYAYEVKSFYFHPTAGGSVQAPGSHASMGFPNFLIEGQVRQEDTGKPVADVPIRIGDETVYADETGVFSLRITRKHAYKMQLLLERQIGAHYYEQVSGPTEVMAGTDEAPGRAQFVVRVNQKKVPSLPKGGIVIGNANAAPDGATGSGQGSGGGDGPA